MITITTVIRTAAVLTTVGIIVSFLPFPSITLDCVLPPYFSSRGPHPGQLVKSSSEYEESLALKISGTVATVLLKNDDACSSPTVGVKYGASSLSARRSTRIGALQAIAEET